MLIIALVVGSGTSAPGSSLAAQDLPFWTGHPDEGSFLQDQQTRLKGTRQKIEQLKAVEGERTVENTLTLYDQILIDLDAVASQASLIENVHPVEEVRQAAEQVSQEAAALQTELSLDPGVYEALAAIDLEDADPETKYYVEKELRDFKLQGVDKDEETRAKIKALRDEMVTIGQEFDRNIRDDVRSVTIDDAKMLDGLPQDYVASHKPDETGHITITTEYPDAIPVFNYAKSEKLRKDIYMAFMNRAYPANDSLLKKLLIKRYELAKLLGYSSWADYILADKMVGNAKNASAFIDRVVDAATDRMKADYAMVLERKREDQPDAEVVNPWESGYYNELVRQARFDFDSQEMRPYFPYARVKQGVLDVTGKLFGVTFHKVDDAPVWDPSVECYEMIEGDKVTGRFYLDMHPRKGKFNHAAQFDVKTGVEGVQMPEAALVCNFPGDQEDDPGLMEFSQVETFFHEFGHLLHTLFAGHHKWCGIGGIRTEWDFVEAPSQMLEEWAMDPTVLASFARHYETGQPIPAEMVMKLRRARNFGKGLYARRQMVLARMSLAYHDRDPKKVDFEAMAKKFNAEYSPYPFPEGTHPQCSFGHLEGYSAFYYTYMWSLVIAKDMFSKFDKTKLLDPVIAKKYRDAVLNPGGSMPAAKLVSNFLGRDFSFDSYREWLNATD